MKIRNGFVSNSSSSSFIIRGILMDKKDLANAWGISIDKLESESEDDDYNKNKIYYNFTYKLDEKACEFGLVFEDTTTEYSRQTDDCVLGKCMGRIGEEEIFGFDVDEVMDEEVKDKLNKSGIKVDKLKFYMQYRGQH